MDIWLKQVIKNRLQDVLFLCGAGISYDYPTELPTVKRFILDILKVCNTETSLVHAIEQKINSNDIVYRFELLINEIRNLRDYRLKVAKVFSSQEYNELHSFLGQMLCLGASVLTTNFDTCIENSINNIDEINKIVYTGIDLACDNLPAAKTLVKIHGSNESEDINNNLVITIKELSKTNQGYYKFPNWRKYLYNLLKNKIVIVIGYSGSDEFDITPILTDALVERYIWIDYNHKNIIPVQVENITDNRIKQLAENKPLTLFSGRTVNIIESWAKILNITLQISKNTSNKNKKNSIQQYIQQVFKTKISRIELVNEVLLNYSLFSQVLYHIDINGCESNNITMQKLKAHYRLGHYSEVVSIITDVYNKLRYNKHKLNALCYQSAVLYYLGQYPEAKEKAQIQLKLAKKMKDDELIVNALNNLGAIYDGNREYKEAKKFYLEAYLKKDNAIVGEATALWGLADIAFAECNYKEALKYFLLVKDIYTKIGHKHNVAYSMMNIGTTLTSLKEFCTAEECLYSAKEFFINADDNNGLLYTLYFFIQLYIKNKSIIEHIDVFTEALNLIENNPKLPIAYEIIVVFLYFYFKNSTVLIHLYNKYRTLHESVIVYCDDERKQLLKSLISNDLTSDMKERIEKEYMRISDEIV